VYLPLALLVLVVRWDVLFGGVAVVFVVFVVRGVVIFGES